VTKKPIGKGPTFRALASGGVRLNWRELRFEEAGKFDTYVSAADREIWWNGSSATRDNPSC